jgi:HEAT repeat protein
VNELAQAAGSERGPLLKAVLRELERRHGDEAVAALGTAAASYESDIQELARSLLLKNLSREGPAVIQNKLKDERAEVRAAAARVAGSRGFHFEVELIDRLTDEHEGVRQAAHDALVQLSRGIDHGPAGGAGKTERDDAVRKWRAWLETREKKKP